MTTPQTDPGSLSDPYLSVIIPTLDELENLRELIPFITGSGPSVGEIIIVDSIHSKDNIKGHFSHPKVKIIRCRENRRSIQLNLGAETARYPILFFMHADMRPPEGFYSDIKKAINDGFSAGCFGYRFDRSTMLLSWLASFSMRKSLFSGGGDQGLFILKEDFNSLGGFDGTLTIMEDFEFYDRIRVQNIGYTIVQKKAVVSARKYDRNSFLRVNVIQLMVFALFKLGLPQSWQLWLYRHGLNHGSQS